jgi:hypothetical protein
MYRIDVLQGPEKLGFGGKFFAHMGQKGYSRAITESNGMVKVRAESTKEALAWGLQRHHGAVRG